MIIDAHTHLGYDYVYEEDLTLEPLLSNMEKNMIDVSIVQPGTVLDLDTVVKEHNEIAALAEDMRGRIYGMANPNPHLPTDLYRKELERCVNTLGFVDLGIPVMVHTGEGIPWTLPSTLIPIAKEFPNLKVIMAHCGTGMFAGEAALAAQLCPNIYLEPSWLPNFAIRDLCKNIGADRVMFGSDMPENVAPELAKFRSIGLTDEELECCLCNTASKVFKIPSN